MKKKISNIPQQRSKLKRKFKGLRELLTLILNRFILPISRNLFKHTMIRGKKTNDEYTSTNVDPSIIYREICHSITDDVAQFIMNISKKYKVYKEAPLLSLKIIDLVNNHGGFNFQATKEFYATAPSIYFNIFRSQEGLIIINQAISILVEAVDTKMAQARQGVDQGNSQAAQKTTEPLLKLCDLLIKSEQAARKVLEMAKSERIQQKINMGIC